MRSTLVDQVLKAHDPEYDVDTSGPPVEWSVAYLAEALKTAMAKVEELEGRVKRLEQRTSDEQPQPDPAVPRKCICGVPNGANQNGPHHERYCLRYAPF